MGQLNVKCLLCAGVSQPGQQKALFLPCSPDTYTSPTRAHFNLQAHPAPLLPDPSPVGGWNPAGQGWQGSQKEPSPTPSTCQHPWWP